MRITDEVKQAVFNFIINNIHDHPNDLIVFTMNHFKISRPTANNLINDMITEGIIVKQHDRGRYPGYTLKTHTYSETYDLTIADLQEDVIYMKSIHPHIKELPYNIQQLLGYATMEIINNAIEHANGRQMTIMVYLNARRVTITITDDGIGIFKKIQDDLGLPSPEQSILELCKGKFTSDPEKHSGEGIFFSSRMADSFFILSRGLLFYGHENNDIIKESEPDLDIAGTMVYISVDLDTKRTPKEIFDEYSDQDKVPTFHKTVIPVKVMNIDGGNIVSRSQAKRLMARVDRFNTVVLDFEGVDMIGQAFADEIFRVFKNTHEQVNIVPINANDTISSMIDHVTHHR